MKNEEYVNEKTMTSTEKKKKEEIVKSMKKDVSGLKIVMGIVLKMLCMLLLLKWQ
jgi:hypothetical protein